MPLTTRDDFEEWLAAMDDLLEEFIAHFPAGKREMLDFTPESLNVVEAWILEKYPDPYSMIKEEENETLDGLACYIGETFRTARGGKWDIRLDDPKLAFYCLPMLTGWEKDYTPMCPVTLATASADRRTGKYLRTVLENTPNF